MSCHLSALSWQFSRWFEEVGHPFLFGILHLTNNVFGHTESFSCILTSIGTQGTSSGELQTKPFYEKWASNL